MLITAHRGASGDYPENTMLAFKKALEEGATAIELDVRRSKDGQMVVFHDETVDRTTNGTGKVSDLTVAELKALDAGNGQQIATLQEVLEMVGGKATIFIEMKGSGTKEVANNIHHAVEEHGFSYAQLPVISFNHTQLFTLKLKNPHIQTGLSFSGKNPQLEAHTMIPLAKTMGASAINPNHSLVTPELVESAHKAGLTVNTWTVNQPEIMRRMADAGVDAIMSDHPGKLRSVLMQHAEKAHEQGTTRHP